MLKHICTLNDFVNLSRLEMFGKNIGKYKYILHQPPSEENNQAWIYNIKTFRTLSWQYGEHMPPLSNDERALDLVVVNNPKIKSYMNSFVDVYDTTFNNKDYPSYWNF